MEKRILPRSIGHIFENIHMESYEGKYFSITNAQEYRTICAYEGNQILLTDKDGNENNIFFI